MMKEFRLTSCCNITYKVIPKILVNKLKPQSPSLVDENQSAFIKTKTIYNNILLMHELVKNYNRTIGPKYCDIKVDIMKTFDALRWQYLLLILKLLNFPESFIKWTGLSLHPCY